MVLVSVQSVENDNGYEFKNDFAESLIINPKSKVSLVNLQFERKADYVILDTGNQFKIQVGSNINPTDTIVITAGTYSAQALCEEIQRALNNTYNAMGHHFNINFNYTDSRFEVEDMFNQSELTNSLVKDWDLGDANYTEQGKIFSDSGVLYLGQTGNPITHAGITDGTANYIQSSHLIETDLVPKLADGGSEVVFEVNWTSAVYPKAGANPPASYGIVYGLADKFSGASPALGQKEISLTANLEWLNCGIVIFSDVAGNPHIKFIEGGQNINAPDKFVPQKGDTYRIILSADGADGVNGYPVYQFKRDGGLYENFNMVGALQRLNSANWRTHKLHPLVGSDTSDIPNQGLSVSVYVDTAGQNSLKPTAITAGDNNERKLNTEYDADKQMISKSVATNNDKATDNQGFITQKIPADSYSQFEFNLRTSTKADFYVAVIDENKRLANQVAQGNDDEDMGVADPAWGNTAKDGDNAFAIETAPNFNPALCCFRFKAWNEDSGYSLFQPNSIYYSHDQNTYNIKAESSLERYWIDADPTDSFDWAGNDNVLFQVKVLGGGNSVELWGSLKGDKTDNVLITSIQIPRVNVNGIKTLNTPATTSAFSAGGVKTFKIGGDRFGKFSTTTDGGGNLTLTDLDILTSGYDYVVNTSYPVIEIDASGSAVGTGAGTMKVASITDYNYTGDMGTNYDPSKASQGYCYWCCFGNKEKAETAPPAVVDSVVDKVALLVQTPNTQTNYVNFQPNFEPAFGATLGFTKQSYLLLNDEGIVSDKAPVPNQQTAEHPTIMVNIDNLPIKSYIGKRYKADALITDKPIGNQQGLTRMIAKVPRHHDDQGDNSGASVGPYFYNYFPYAVPLNNATELVLNELDISVRNPDGTLAKDIIQTHLLLDISNVENVGEQVNMGRIGRPKRPPMGYDKLDITKGQLQPEIRGGFAQGSESLKAPDTADPWGHGHLGADKSHAL